MKPITSFAFIVMGVLISTTLFSGNDARAEGAWIGTGSGSIGSSTGDGGSWGCNYTSYGYAISCAGVSWAFYKSTGAAGWDVEFPYLGGGIRTADTPTIPATCSEHTNENGGFWHFGINAWGAGYGDQDGWGEGWQSGSLWTNGDSWTSYKRFYGHWTTITPSIFDGPYVSSFPSGRNYFPDYRGWPEAQQVGVYKLDRFASSTWEVLEAYNKARASAGYEPLSYLPSDVWGFCYWDGMEGSIEGKSTVGNERLTSSNTTDWVNQNTTANTYYLDCTPSGCKVKFSHNLRRKAGNFATDYTIKRVSNYTQEGVTTKTLKASSEDFSSVSGDSGKEEYSEVLTLKPGQVVCESLEFSPRGNDEKATTTVCAAAKGNAQPGSGNTLLNIKVKNKDVTKYNNYQETVYAKPNDTVNYQSTYNPVLQYTYYLVPEKMQIDDGTIYPTDGKNSSLLMWNMFNTYRNSGSNNGRGLKTWNNDFSVWRSGNSFSSQSLVQYYDFRNGDTTSQQVDNDYKIAVGDVGKSIDEKAITNVYDSSSKTSKTTPSQVTFYEKSGFDVGNVKTGAVSSVAYVRVPYNYINTTEVKSSQTGDIVYGGEDVSIMFDVSINPKSNSYTMKNGDKDYATSVGNGKYKLDVCIGGHVGAGCRNRVEYPNSDGKAFSSTERAMSLDNMFKTKTFGQSLPIHVSDVPAGTDVCVVSMVYPATSGNDNNYNDKDGDHKWKASAEKCFKVAKKPSLQVWGGNIYSSGNINTALADKKNLAGYNVGDTHAFGSWGELGIIASGTIKGLSSGASLGYSGLGLERAPGGSTSSKLCDNSPLSLANENCNSNYVGMINAVSANNPAANVINKDRDGIIRKFSFKDGENNSNILYEYNAGNYEIGEETINKSIIKVYQSDETITITGNLSYEDAQYSYTRNGNNADGDFLPKLVIIAKNINIACNVNRIDGVLLAESTVTTSKCEGSEDINARVNSNPLTINGAVIAGKIIPNRTYGAGPGNNSMVSAETINFDPSLYLWGQLGSKETEGSGEDTSSGSGGKRDYLDLTYTRELAPRY